MHYIGMDTHISTLDFAVIDEKGKLKKSGKIPTSVKGMIDFIKAVPKPRTLYIEEGTLAAWVVETCHGFSEKVVVTDPKKNYWIGRDEEKDDKVDAFKLAQLARGGYIKEIPHAVGNRRRFRELILYYHDQVKLSTRLKNKIKCKFRQNGIQCFGTTVYLKHHQKTWFAKLPQEPVVHIMVKRLWKELDTVNDGIKEAVKAMNKLGKEYSEIKRFKKIPGIGVIHAASISAIIEDPNRFATVKKVWKYAGFGIVERGSSDKVYSSKLTHNYNRTIKYTIKQAVQAAVRSKNNPFRKKFIYLTVIKNIEPSRALLIVCRKYLKIIWTLWKKGEDYKEEVVMKTINQLES